MRQKSNATVNKRVQLGKKRINTVIRPKRDSEMTKLLFYKWGTVNNS